jgi:oxygen-independent coproporphyrinogen-3 oxidase
LGITAIGKVGDTYGQNVKETAQYQHRLESGRLPVMRGYRLSDDDRLRRDVISTLMCHGEVDFAVIEAAHGITFSDYFAEALTSMDAMQADGLVKISERRLDVLPAGRLMMRNLAMAFDAYLTPREERYSRTV